MNRNETDQAVLGYATRITVDSSTKFIRLPSGEIDITRQYSPHKLIYGLFDTPTRLLFRQLNSRKELGRQYYAVSLVPPKKLDLKGVSVKVFPVRDDFFKHGRYSFTIDVCPVLIENKGEKGDFNKMIDKDTAMQNFERMAKACGFNVTYYKHIKKNRLRCGAPQGRSANRKGVFHNITVNGELVVDDVDKFTDAYFRGIGRGKSLGLGMLYLYPLD